jgi:hypothetical protein
MEQNPYAAPAARVADADAVRPAERPIQVTRAVWLLWTVLALGTVVNFIRPQGAVPMGMLMAIVIWLLSTAIYVLFIVKIAAGRNWARIVYLVLTLLGFLFIPVSWSVLVEVMKSSVLYTVVYFLNTAISVYALYLLFTKPANAWFRPTTRAVH